MRFSKFFVPLFALLLVSCTSSHLMVEQVEGPPAKNCPKRAAVDVLALVNAYREEQGLKKLGNNKLLIAAAKDHARWMAANDTLSHEGANDERAIDRAGEKGYHDIKLIGENIADGQGTAVMVVNSWKKSPPHNDNLLNPYVRDTGIACAPNKNGRPYWVIVVGARE
jgi:uncharacterized protein YkwD